MSFQSDSAPKLESEMKHKNPIGFNEEDEEGSENQNVKVTVKLEEFEGQDSAERDEHYLEVAMDEELGEMNESTEKSDEGYESSENSSDEEELESDEEYEDDLENEEGLSFDDGVESTEAVGTEESSEEGGVKADRTGSLNKLFIKKITLINEYLAVMNHVQKLRMHNLYLQDNLYKICIRKKLIKDEDELNRKPSTGTTLRAASKARRQKRKLEAKMANNLEAFLGFKKHPEISPPMKQRRGDTQKLLSRQLRLVFRGIQAPDFQKRLDRRILFRKGAAYQRQMHNISRNWSERTEQDEEKYFLLQLKLKAIERQNPHKKILMGFERAPKRRVLIKVVKTPKNAKKSDKILETVPEQNAVEVGKGRQNYVNKRHTVQGISMKSSTNVRKSAKNLQNVREVNSVELVNKHQQHTGDGTYQDHSQPQEDDATAENQQMKAKKSNFALWKFGARNRKSVKGAAYKRNIRRLRLGTNVDLINLAPASPVKFTCRPKKPFARLEWFDPKNNLSGRQYSGAALLPAEKHHLINFVDDALSNKPQRNKLKKLKMRRQEDTIHKDWNDAIDKLFILIKKTSDLDTQHKANMERQLAAWALWEQRNSMCVEGLFLLFSAFVQQDYLTQEVRKSFAQDIHDFRRHLNTSHANLMQLLIRMYGSRKTLILIQREVKNTTNPVLAQNGFSTAEYEIQAKDNDIYYEKLLKMETYLERENKNMEKLMTSTVKKHDLKRSLKASVRQALVQTKAYTELSEERIRLMKQTQKSMFKVLDREKSFSLVTGLVERPRLLQDFLFRNQALTSAEKDRRALVREVSLRERELNCIHIKMASVKLKMKEFCDERDLNRNAQQARIHSDNLQGNMNRMILKSLNPKCTFK